MIVVTGGAGFIGSAIIKGLQDEGYQDIVVVDWLGNGNKWKNIAKRELAAIVAPEDLQCFLEAHKQAITAVINMGGISATTEKDADLIIKSNFRLSWDLWTFCRDNGKQFIYASSAATYGGGENGFVDTEELEYLNELRPLNAYGWSKALFDRKVRREIIEGRGTPRQYAGLKFFNVYGPNEYHKGGQKSVIAHMFPEVKAGREAMLFKSYNPEYKDGQQLRDFVWVGDCVNVVIWLLEHTEVNGIFNVGSGEARSFYDLATAVFDSLDLPAKIDFKEMPEELRSRYQYYTKAPLEKLRNAGYKNPMTSLEDGVNMYVQKYLNTEDPYM